MGVTPSKPTHDRIGEQLRREADLQASAFPSAAGETLAIQNQDGSTITLGYATYGGAIASSKHVILFFHGTPGTRFFFSACHSDLCTRHGIAVVVPERPGFGLSTPLPGRSLSSSVQPFASLLDHLHVRSVHALGYSAGGPFALAFASQFPDRCASLSVVSSLSPNARGVMQRMTLLSRLGYLLAIHSPRLLQAVVKKLVPGALDEVFDSRRADFSKAENDFFEGRADVRRTFAKSACELYCRDAGAVAEAEDYVLMARDWDFALADVGGAFDIRVYGGAEDYKCTPAMFHVLVDRLPKDRVTALLAEGENHLYFYKLFEDRLLADLHILNESDL